jgi:tRNA pseudouridine38-40 synthase
VRLRLDLAYDGTEFSGWAAQPSRRTVQLTVEQALARVLGQPTSTICAGRTDAGVHARGQVCHLDVSDASDVAGLCRRLNAVLPPDVRVRRVTEVAPDFDARFSALWRRYGYRICDCSSQLDSLRRREVLSWHRPLDVGAMNAASRPLLGEHDFAAFCRRRDTGTTVRTLRELSWSRDQTLVRARVVADAFCHHMVRSIVGASLAVGEGRRPVGWPAEVLAAQRRDSAVHVAPPHGLTLEEVGYPPDDQLAGRSAVARAVRSRHG